MARGIWTDNNTFKEFDKGTLGFDFATLQNSPAGIGSLLKTLPDPDPVLKKMGKDIAVFKEIATDTRISAAIAQRLSLTKSLSPYIECRDEKNKEFWGAYLKNIGVRALIKDIFDSVLYGYSVIELNWEIRDGYLLPTKLVQKPQEWFKFGVDGSVRFLAKGKQDGEELPLNKFLITQNNPSYTNPYGEKLMSKVFWYAIFRKNGWKFFMQFGEKYGMPWAIGKMPRNTPQAKADELLNSLENMVADAVGVIPDDSSVELLTVQGKNGEGLYKTIIDMLGEEISIAICGQNLTSQVKGGSFAAGKMHLDILTILADDDRKLVEGSLNNLLRMICEVNAIKDIPTLSLVADDEIDNTLSERDERLAKIGVKFTKKYFVKNYGFEEDEIEVVDIVNNQTPPSASSFNENPTRLTAGIEAAQAVIDNGIDTIDPKKSNDAATSILRPALQIIANSASYEEALNSLAESYAEMNDDELVGILERAIFISEAVGRLNAQ